MTECGSFSQLHSTFQIFCGWLKLNMAMQTFYKLFFCGSLQAALVRRSLTVLGSCHGLGLLTHLSELL